MKMFSASLALAFSIVSLSAMANAMTPILENVVKNSPVVRGVLTGVETEMNVVCDQPWTIKVHDNGHFMTAQTVCSGEDAHGDALGVAIEIKGAIFETAKSAGFLEVQNISLQIIP